MLRKVVGESMTPGLLPGDLVMGVRRHTYRVGDVVILEHNGLEKIKRIAQVKANKVFVMGDNLAASKDSRHFGWLDMSLLRAKVVWPHYARRKPQAWR